MTESTLIVTLSYDKKEFIASSGLLGTMPIVNDNPLTVRYFSFMGEYWFMSSDIQKVLGVKVSIITREVKPSWIKRVVRTDEFRNHFSTDDRNSGRFLANDNWNFISTEGLMLLLDLVKKNPATEVSKTEVSKTEVIDAGGEEETDAEKGKVTKPVYHGLSKSCYEFIEKELKDPELIKVFYSFLEMRKKSLKKPVTGSIVEELIGNLREVSGGSVEEAVQIVRNSLINCWKRFFPLREIQKDEINQSTCADNSFLSTQEELGKRVDEWIFDMRRCGVKKITIEF